MSRQEDVLEIARETGFDLAGIAPLRPPRDLELFDQWLAAGRHAGMRWLERSRDRIADPRAVLREGRSMLLVGLAHSRAAVEVEGGGRVARYAAGRDYHNVVGKMLRKLRKALVEAGVLPREARSRQVVDAGPVLERSHAAEAGLGFLSKASNLLHPRFGPWFFLGELLLELELEPTTTTPVGSCGTCRLCIDACPTQAILEPGLLDARLCLSYHTIENRGAVPIELRPALDDRAFGCDVCSEVCPWGREAPDVSERFGVHPALDGGLVGWLSIRDEQGFADRTRGSPLSRPGRAGLARNAAIVLGNRPGDQGRVALLEALSFDPSGLVRESAAWALAHGYRRDQGVQAALERALGREGEPAVAEGLRGALDGRG